MKKVQQQRPPTATIPAEVDNTVELVSSTSVNSFVLRRIKSQAYQRWQHQQQTLNVQPSSSLETEEEERSHCVPPPSPTRRAASEPIIISPPMSGSKNLHSKAVTQNKKRSSTSAGQPSVSCPVNRMIHGSKTSVAFQDILEDDDWLDSADEPPSDNILKTSAHMSLSRKGKNTGRPLTSKTRCARTDAGICATSSQSQEKDKDNFWSASQRSSGSSRQDSTLIPAETNTPTQNQCWWHADSSSEFFQSTPRPRSSSSSEFSRSSKASVRKSHSLSPDPTKLANRRPTCIDDVVACCLPQPQAHKDVTRVSDLIEASVVQRLGECIISEHSRKKEKQQHTIQSNIVPPTLKRAASTRREILAGGKTRKSPKSSSLSRSRSADEFSMNSATTSSHHSRSPPPTFPRNKPRRKSPQKTKPTAASCA